MYELQFESSHLDGTLEAFCGYGSESLCEMKLQTKNRKTFRFTRPADIWVLQIKKRIYIVNGVAIDGGRKIKTKDYAVNELLPDGLQRVCTNF
jgi:hypothetical protein